MEEFAGKTAVVTSTGSGMGKAFALRWGAEGMNVVIGDIQVQTRLRRPSRSLSAAGSAGARAADRRVVDWATSRPWPTRPRPGSGPIHLVNNNAGVEGYLDGPIWSATKPRAGTGRCRST